MTSRHAILFPMLALVLLTMVVGIVMYRRRVAEMRAKRIPPQAVATATQMAARLSDTCAADNFRNLFETPLLFYAAVLTIYAAELTSPLYVTLAWVYVVLRLVHSAIHCTYNNVMHRLSVFMAAFLALSLIWGLIAWDVAIVGRG
jgi:hypothetical protein